MSSQPLGSRRWMRKASILVCIACMGGGLGGIVLNPDIAEAAPESWSIIPSPNVGVNNWLVGVSCPDSNDCFVVGYRGYKSDETLVESWNGSAWSVMPSPNASGSSDNFLDSVSCVTSTSCMSVGDSYVGSDTQTLVESWNGTAWSILPSPNPNSA